MTANFESARAFAKRGKPIFPCRPMAKEPLTPHGFKDASTDLGAVDAWWQKHPDANIAMATGQGSGFVVLDVDVDNTTGKDGEVALASLVESHGPLPPTLEVHTPRGGRHLYYKYPANGPRIPCSTDKLGHGLDVRGDGGYIMLPPSRTERGEYRWESKSPPAELPGWLLELMIGSASNGTRSEPTNAGVSGNADVEEPRVREALSYITADLPHGDWVRILMALHDWDPNRGRVLAEEWSASCPEKFRAGDFDAAWRSFKPGGGVGLGTLFEMAKRRGWRSRAREEGRQKNGGAKVEEPAELMLAKWPEPARPEAFYGAIGEFVRRLEPHTESDPMAILVQTLVGLGNLMGRTAYFMVEADRHYCNLNAATVGNSSKARKGTSWGQVNRLLRQVDPTWPRSTSGLSTGEGLIYAVRDPITETDDNGAEELVDPGVLDKRFLALESEFGRTLQCSNREGNTLSAVVRQAFDTGDLRVATKGSPQMATGAHISIIGHITGVELNLLLTKSDTANGFANRFLWVAVRRSKLLPEGGNAGALDMSDVVERLRQTIQFARTVGCVTRDDAAVARWREIYYQLSRERPGLLGSVISRAEALVMRLAMIFALTDRSPKIRVPHLEAALAVWDYCEASAAFIFGDSIGNPLAERVLQLLQQAPENGLSLAAIYERLSGHVERDELHAALKQLHGQGLAECRKMKTSGRPLQVWFATKAAGEKSEQSAKKVSNDGRAPVAPPSVEDLSSLNSLNSPEEEWVEEI